MKSWQAPFFSSTCPFFGMIVKIFKYGESRLGVRVPCSFCFVSLVRFGPRKTGESETKGRWTPFYRYS